MKEVTIHEAKTYWLAHIRSAEAGESIRVKRGYIPVARLLPIEKSGKDRTLGQCRGQTAISPDFDAPLPPDLAVYFE